MCGRHRSVKAPRLWVDAVKDKTAPLVRFQAIFRGWKVRHYLALCGPGVLRRGDCVNDEELVTLVDKHRQDPFDYVGLEEAGKIWWFDFCTLWDWSIRSIEPTNPYTKVALSHEVKQRLKKLWVYRRRKGMTLVSEAGVPTADRILRRWTAVCQVFRFCGFVRRPDQGEFGGHVPFPGSRLGRDAQETPSRAELLHSRYPQRKVHDSQLLYHDQSECIALHAVGNQFLRLYLHGPVGALPLLKTGLVAAGH